MNSYYCTNYAPEDTGVYEFAYMKADSEDEALQKFKNWFARNYGHLFDDLEDFRYEVEPA